MELLSRGWCMFNLIINCQTAFQSVLPWYTPTCKVWELQFLHILTNARNVSFFNCSYLVSVKTFLTAVVICVSMMTNDVRYICMFLLSTWVSSLGTFSFNLCLFLTVELFVFFLLNECRNSSCILDTEFWFRYTFLRSNHLSERKLLRLKHIVILKSS